MRNLFIVLLLGASLSINSVGAQGLNREHGEHLKYIQAQDVDMLFDLLNDDSVTLPLKIKGMARLGAIYRERPDALDKNADEVFNVIISTRDKYNKDAKEENELRRESVLALGIFSKNARADQAIDQVNGSLTKDKNYQVNSSAAHILREFTNNAKKANNALIAKLDESLKKSVWSEDDLRLTFTIISSMGSLGEKRSFIPLMRVLQSGYPIYVKKAAEEAIGSIDWEK